MNLYRDEMRFEETAMGISAEDRFDENAWNQNYETGKDKVFRNQSAALDFELQMLVPG